MISWQVLCAFCVEVGWQIKCKIKCQGLQPASPLVGLAIWVLATCLCIFWCDLAGRSMFFVCDAVFHDVFVFDSAECQNVRFCMWVNLAGAVLCAFFVEDAR